MRTTFGFAEDEVCAVAVKAESQTTSYVIVSRICASIYMLNGWRSKAFAGDPVTVGALTVSELNLSFCILHGRLALFINLLTATRLVTLPHPLERFRHGLHLDYALDVAGRF